MRPLLRPHRLAPALALLAVGTFAPVLAPSRASTPTPAARCPTRRTAQLPEQPIPEQSADRPIQPAEHAGVESTALSRPEAESGGLVLREVRPGIEPRPPSASRHEVPRLRRDHPGRRLRQRRPYRADQRTRLRAAGRRHPAAGRRLRTARRLGAGAGLPGEQPGRPDEQSAAGRAHGSTARRQRTGRPHESGYFVERVQSVCLHQQRRKHRGGRRRSLDRRGDPRRRRLSHSL